MIYILNTIILFLLYLGIQKYNLTASEFIELNDVIFYLCLSVFVNSATILISSKIRFNILKKIFIFLAIVLSYLPALTIFAYNYSLKAKITNDAIFAVLQSNAQEALQYSNNFINLTFIFVAIFCFAVLFTLIMLQKKEIEIKRELYFVVVISFVPLFIFNSRLLMFIDDGVNLYQKEL